jgi:hypothetical protein
MLVEASRIYRKAGAPMQVRLSDALSILTDVRMSLGKFREAEQPATELLNIRRRKMPDNWRRYSAERTLGAVLLGMGELDKAEPLLLSGYDGMKKLETKIPDGVRYIVADAARCLVELYKRKHDPAQGAAWRRKLPRSVRPPVRAVRPPVAAVRPR